MQFGEKITLLRKKQNMTQEQLADYLGVSRQSVYKWENNLSYPETETLIKMAKLYDCTLDYLLNENCNEEKNEPVKRKLPKEYVSKKKVFGKPLIHIAKNADGFIAIGIKAKGYISIGCISRGIFFSCGVISLGLFSVGTLSLGLLAIGLFAFGLLAIGTFSVGLISIGAIAIGLYSLGSIAVGEFAVGALGYAKYASIGAVSYGDIAITSETGKSYGACLNYIGDLTAADKEEIVAYLNENVPAILSIFKNMFLWFIR